MIKPPSFRNDYTHVFSDDPALSLPTDEKERANVLRVARETGQWQALIRDGEAPTLFQLRPLTEAARYFYLGEHARNRFTNVELSALLVRLGLRRVDNLTGAVVDHDQREGFEIARVEIINTLGAVVDGMKLVLELGAVIAERTFESPSPK